MKKLSQKLSNKDFGDLVSLECEVEELKDTIKHQQMTINNLRVGYFRRFLKVDIEEKYLTINIQLFRKEFDGTDNEQFFIAIEQILNSTPETPYDTLYI